MAIATEVGAITVHRIVESVCTGFAPREFFPQTTPEDWARHRGWMTPRALDPASGNLVLTIQGFLVRTRHHTIVVDTCVGDHKPRAARPFWDMQKLDSFLPRLAAAGVAPEEVDYVMCTHLHWDHVGWHTRLREGRWQPTFPNAKYVFARAELESFEALHRKKAQPHMADSIAPVLEAGQALLVAGDFALDDEVALVPSPGHTPGHVCVRLASQGAEAMITGDAIHSPVQCAEPQWIMQSDADPALACRTRRGLLERWSESGALVCASHFPESSFGRIAARGGAFRFDEAL